MPDFSLKAYIQYINLIKKKYPHILRFDEYFRLEQKPDSFCLIRHDVDRKPENALRMAQTEKGLGVKSTYYFRVKPRIFDNKIIGHIADLSHEIGYHYESLTDHKGNMAPAIDDFRRNLEAFRKIIDVKTISMHGRPFSPFDNRDMWRTPAHHKLLQDTLGILGEVYLDIDYGDIAYINDTGRNWGKDSSNVRDKVSSKIEADFASSKALMDYLQGNPHTKLIFQIHPERWTDNRAEYFFQYAKDLGINAVKLMIKSIISR